MQFVNARLMERHTYYRDTIDDFQHQVEKKIKHHKDEANFPKMEGNLDQEELGNYLFDYQAALDTEGSERTQYTIAGFLLSLPILVLSAFPEKTLPVKGYQVVLLGLAIGLLLFLFYKIVMKIIVRSKVKQAKADHPEACLYVEKVMRYNK